MSVTTAESTPLSDKVALTVELLDTMVAGIRDVHIALTIDGNAPRRAQLSGFLRQRAAGMAGLGTAAPLGEQLRQYVGAGIELLHAVITHIDDIHRAVGLIYGDPAREIELTVAVAETAP